MKTLQGMNTYTSFDVGIESSNQHCVKFPRLRKFSATRASAGSRQNPRSRLARLAPRPTPAVQQSFKLYVLVRTGMY